MFRHGITPLQFLIFQNGINKLMWTVYIGWFSAFNQQVVESKCGKDAKKILHLLVKIQNKLSEIL